MVTTSENSYFIVCNLVNDSVFFINAPRPAAAEFVFERFGFADAGEWFALDFFNQADDA
jgi:hypothetical protein